MHVRIIILGVKIDSLSFLFFYSVSFHISIIYLSKCHQIRKEMKTLGEVGGERAMESMDGSPT